VSERQASTASTSPDSAADSAAAAAVPSFDRSLMPTSALSPPGPVRASVPALRPSSSHGNIMDFRSKQVCSLQALDLMGTGVCLKREL